jgi:UDP-4-amino-4,6-dideoxy-N-acetyl-beta-L-altrosamine transaminase
MTTVSAPLAKAPHLAPVTQTLPYGRHLIEPDDVAAVVEVLTSGQLTQGPKVEAFEQALAATVGATAAVACSSGTAALHLILAALDVGPGDLCIVPAISFLSTATAVRFCGAEVVFADVDPLTGHMTPQTLRQAAARADRPVKVALPVHLGGRMVDMPGLADVAAELGLLLVEDACHALGSTRAGARAGGCDHSAASSFSFHPVKTIACGEGGMAVANDPALAERMRRLRNHGVTHDPALMVDAALSLDPAGQRHPWSYEQLELGFNYRMTDLEAALGLSQLHKLDRFVARRRDLAAAYDRRLAPLAGRLWPVRPARDEAPSLHLYAVQIDFHASGLTRDALMRHLAAQGIGTQVHYIPLYRQPYFAHRYGPLRLPGAEAWYDHVLALPLFPAMADEDVDRVVDALQAALAPSSVSLTVG